MNLIKITLGTALIAVSSVGFAAVNSTDPATEQARQQRMDDALSNYRQTHPQGAPGTGRMARAERSVKNGFHRAGTAVKHGAQRTGHAIKRGAERTGEAIENTGEKIKEKASN